MGDRLCPVHWLCWQPTPYNDFLFQRLARDPALRLTVHYRERVLPSHPWKTRFGQGYEARYYKRNLWVDWQVVRIPLRKPASFFVVGGWDHPTAIILLTLLRVLGRRYAIWTDTPNLSRRRYPLKAVLRERWLRWIFGGAARIMGTGIPGVEALRQMGAPDEKLANFPYFIDLDLYRREHRAQHSSPRRPVRFLSVGRVQHSIKGHDIAVRTLANVAFRQRNPPLVYRIAGTGPDEANIKQLARDLGIADRVHTLDWVEPSDMDKLYQESDVLLHPSPAHDPFGNAVLEAMAAGLVVFASDVTGAALDRIQNGINGFIHKAGDVNGLAEQICWLLQQPERITEIGRRARTTAEEWPVERGIATIREMIVSCVGL